MRMGIGIGWPNASASNSPLPPTVYSFLTTSCCAGDLVTLYTTSPSFQVGIMVYTDPELQIPYTQGEYGGTRLGNVGCPFPFNDGYAIENGLVIESGFTKGCD